MCIINSPILKFICFLMIIHDTVDTTWTQEGRFSTWLWLLLRQLCTFFKSVNSLLRLSPALSYSWSVCDSTIYYTTMSSEYVYPDYEQVSGCACESSSTMTWGDDIGERCVRIGSYYCINEFFVAYFCLHLNQSNTIKDWHNVPR